MSTLTAVPLHGIWRVMPSPMLTEIFSRGGMQFQILDCEHGAYDYQTLLPDILACERYGCVPLVRVSGTDKVEVQRCLDLGARGIVFPQLATPEDFSRSAAMMDYAPAGSRGFNPFVRAGGYGFPSADAVARSRPWFMPIVETLAAVEAIDEIARLPRLDVVYVGVYDLSAQLGCPGRMDSPELLLAVEQVLSACRRAGKATSLMALSPAMAQDLAARGVQAIVHGVETHRLSQAVGDILQPMNRLTLPAGTTPLTQP